MPNRYGTGRRRQHPRFTGRHDPLPGKSDAVHGSASAAVTAPQVAKPSRRCSGRPTGMRIATWNVNSLRARLEKLGWWLDRARPDVLLLQETKLADDDVPVEPFERRGYRVAHHGEGRWNGVAIASRVGLDAMVTNFGLPLGPPRTPEVSDDEPLAEARMVAAVCGGIRAVSVYAPNGRVVGSPFYRAKLAWYERLARWLEERCTPGDPLVVGGDMNVAPEDVDVWDPGACHGGTHVSEPERQAFARLCTWGLVDAYRRRHPEPGRYTWWDYRAGNFHKNYGMRIDHLLVTPPLAARLVAAEIDREARKGKPLPSDHAPVVIDVDAPGHPFDPGWAGAEARIAARRARRP
jgi:exodeoxyribonuclease-3